MDPFRTIFPLLESDYKIHHSEQIMSIGSCFAQEISQYLKSFKFKIFQSPFGIVFNPLSIEIQLRKILDNYTYVESDLINNQGLFNSFDHHSSISNQDKSLLLLDINNGIKTARENIHKAKYFIITFGSSYYYNYLPKQKVVANCHKIPAEQFEKKKASTEELIIIWTKLLNDLFAVNSGLQIIFSISPVRYLRDGFVENNRSKASLIQLVESIQNSFSNITYFPAYEIFMDDLRDYRFVKDDLVHPNEFAIKYICQYFSNTFFNQGTQSINQRIKEILDMQNHRINQPDSKASKSFKKILESKMDKFKIDYPEIE
ncbi:MAG: GSCFA domain-containing protein [Saprospiraceae bacterium]